MQFHKFGLQTRDQFPRFARERLTATKLQFSKSRKAGAILFRAISPAPINPQFRIFTK